MRLSKALSVSLVIVLLCLPVCGEDARQPVPEASKLKEAEKLIKEVFKAEYAQTKPEDKAALAKKLSQQADETKDDPAARYVAWKEASALAVQSGDMETALAALDKLGARFAVDIVALKKTALTALAASTRDPELSRAIGGMKTLLDTPDDPGASLLVGKYLCFVKGNWEQGLLLFAKGADAVLKAMAEKELAQPTDGAAQMSVADSWWDMAEKEPAKQQKAAMQGRAKFWYEKALPSLTGLTKTKAEKRIAATAAVNAAAAPPISGGGLPQTTALDLGGGVKMEFVLVPAGEFMMGSNDGPPEEKPAHKVKISKPYYIGKFDVTVAQFRAFADTAKYQTEAEMVHDAETVKDGSAPGQAWERRKRCRSAETFLIGP